MRELERRRNFLDNSNSVTRIACMIDPSLSVSPSIFTLFIEPRISEVKLTLNVIASSQTFCLPVTKLENFDVINVETAKLVRNWPLSFEDIIYLHTNSEDYRSNANCTQLAFKKPYCDAYLNQVRPEISDD